MVGENLLEQAGYLFYEIMFWLQILGLFSLPIVLSIWNILSFIRIIRCKDCNFKEFKCTKFMEVFGILSGLFLTQCAMYTITFVSWWEEIDYISTYPPVAWEYTLTFVILIILGVIGYCILRFIPLEKQSPLVTVISISAMYYTMILCFIFCIQIFNGPSNSYWWLALILPINIIILFTKVILLVVKKITQKLSLENEENYDVDTNNQDEDLSLIEKLKSYLKKASDYPKLALILLLPMLAIVVIILILFGQKPDSLVAMWTDTAEWNLSTKIPPPKINYQGHYLCTVAVCGSPNLVKPLWVGERGGHKILVNRQLAIANAFEQVLEEKLPKFHRIVRGFYDKTGYPISKHITSKSSSNFTYLIMKPLEWCFVLVLYLVDVNPENRIYSQYRYYKKS